MNREKLARKEYREKRLCDSTVRFRKPVTALVTLRLKPLLIATKIVYILL